ncbi:MAG TPA: hypothetical protein VIG33_12045 [Pseudobdellovibrionaceae bacterium]|jgi:hypothetical protein
MKISLVCLFFAFGLGLSACSHFGFGKKCCDKSSCSMEHGEHAKDAKGCCGGECEMKK